MIGSLFFLVIWISSFDVRSVARSLSLSKLVFVLFSSISFTKSWVFGVTRGATASFRLTHDFLISSEVCVVVDLLSNSSKLCEQIGLCRAHGGGEITVRSFNLVIFRATFQY